MFTPARLLLMVSYQPPQSSPPKFEEFGGSHRGVGSRAYDILFDVAGQDKSCMSVGAGLVPAQDIYLANPGRDSIRLSIVKTGPATVEPRIAALKDDEPCVLLATGLASIQWAYPQKAPRPQPPARDQS